MFCFQCAQNRTTQIVNQIVWIALCLFSIEDMNQSKFRPSRGCKLIQVTCFGFVVSGKWNVSPKPKSKIFRSGQKGSATRRCYKLTKPDRPSVKGVAYSAVPGLCGLVEWWELWSFGYLSRARPIATNPRMAGSWGAESGCGQKLRFCWSIGARSEGKSIDLGVQKGQCNMEHMRNIVVFLNKL